MSEQNLKVKDKNHIEDYIYFLMEKNNLKLEEAQKLFQMGWNCFGEEGFSGKNYGEFTEFYSEAYSWKYGPSEEIYHKTYEFHSSIDFFRMLGYPTYTCPRDLILYEELINHLKDLDNQTDDIITIVDYGAGLAQVTLTLTKLLAEAGVKTKLIFIDIPRFTHKEFLEFIGNRHNLNIEFIDITNDNPYPKIPAFDFIQIKDVFEHVHKPEKIVDNIESSIRNFGIISATTEDEGPEMMHVTRDLKVVRDRFESYNFNLIEKSFFNRGDIFQKGSTDE